MLLRRPRPCTCCSPLFQAVSWRARVGEGDEPHLFGRQETLLARVRFSPGRGLPPPFRLRLDVTDATAMPCLYISTLKTRYSAEYEVPLIHRSIQMLTVRGPAAPSPTACIPCYGMFCIFILFYFFVFILSAIFSICFCDNQRCSAFAVLQVELYCGIRKI